MQQFGHAAILVPWQSSRAHQAVISTRNSMGGEHCHNSTRARFSYSGRAISYSSRAVSYSGRAVSYLGGAISYLGGAISLQLRNSTLGKNVLLQLRYRHDIS